MAKCFDVVGYIEPCNAVRQKYTGRALLITSLGLPLEFSSNGLILTKIMEQSSFPEFYNATKEITSIKSLPISINAENPFGVTVQGNTDSGRVMYTKTIPVSIPSIRDGKAEEFIMGLKSGIKGNQAILVVEILGTGSENDGNTDVFGAYSAVYIDPTSVTRSEYENGGAWQFNLVCEEPVHNVICTMSDFATVLDTLKA